MNVYYAGDGGMGSTARGIAVLQELGGGLLVGPYPFRFAVEAAGFKWRPVGTWLDLPSGATAIFDRYSPASPRRLVRLRARKYLISSREDKREKLLAACMDGTFSTNEGLPNAEVVGPILAPPDERAGNYWWEGWDGPRLLIVAGGRDENEALALGELARRARLRVKVCAPWWTDSRYWPATDLIATADVVLGVQGGQLQVECEALGCQFLDPFTVRINDLAGYVQSSNCIKAEIRPLSNGAQVIASRIKS